MNLKHLQSVIHARSGRWFAHAAMSLAALFALPAVQAQDFPNRPVRLVVPYSAGGVTDVTARAIAQEMGKEFGQQVIVDNRPGAGGMLGMDNVAKSNPDGYTIGFCASGVFVIQPHLDAKLPLDPIKDLVPVSHIYDASLVLTVRPDSPITSFQKLVELAKSNPNGITYGSVGIGSAHQLGMEVLRQRAGGKFVHVPYKGDAQQITDLLGGNLDVAILSTQAAANLAKGGKARLIASTGLQRAPGLNDVPTIAESGYPGFAINTWIGTFVPAKTPKAVVDRLHQVTTRVLKQPAIQQQMEAQGLRPNGADGAELAKFIASESARAEKTIREQNIKVE